MHLNVEFRPLIVSPTFDSVFGTLLQFKFHNQNVHINIYYYFY